MRFSAFLLLLVLGLTQTLSAQVNELWSAYSSLNNVRFIEEDAQGRIWAATDGGLFSVVDGTPDAVMSRADGLYQLNPTAMVYDPKSELIWMGYEDGMLESFDPQTELFQREDAIYRASQYTRRNIANIRVHNDRLYVATGFGVVIYDPDRRIVVETYSNLGNFPSGTGVNDIALNGTTIYVGTDLGVAMGNSAQADLANPANWTILPNPPNLNIVRTLAYFRDLLYVSISNRNYTYNGVSWQEIPQLTFGGIQRYRRSASGNALVAIAPQFARVISASGDFQSVENAGKSINDVYLDDRSGQQILLGSLSDGLLELANFSDTNPQSLTPSGPYMNFFNGLKVIDGTLISGTSASPGRFPSTLVNTGYSIFKDGVWTNRNKATDAGMREYDAHSYYVSTGNSNYYFFGSWGDGIVMHDVNNDATEVFNFASGAPINPTVSPDFIVVPGMGMDSNQQLWFSVFLANPNVLYRFDPVTKTFTGYPRNSNVNLTEHYLGLYVDSFDQKWIPIVDASQNGRGLLVLDQGDLNDISDDQSVYLTQSLNNLPNNKVQTVIQDKRGEIWVGTSEGMARFLFPDRVIRGNSADRQAERLRIRNELTGDVTFFLNRTSVTALAVNAANEKWIGTQGDGVYHVREAGGMVTILNHFTTANSPMPSDNVVSLAVDDMTGRVYIATDMGLVSYNDVVKSGVAKMDELKVYPNPYVYDKNTGTIYIDGLSDETRVHVLSVDGRLIRRLNVSGGRSQWDALDENGRQLATGVYTVVAVDRDGSQKGMGKVVIVR